MTFKQGLKDGIPIMLAYFAVSLAFGVSAVGLGVPSFIAVIMSMTNLTSAGQQAGVIIVAGLGTVFEIMLTQLVINARYFLMSLSLSQKLDKKFTLLDRFLCAFGITDEIFAVAVSKKGEVSKKFMFGLILLPFLGWTLGTLVGVLLGNALPSLIVNALHIAIYAMFIGIVIPSCFVDKKIIPVILLSAGLSSVFFFVPVLAPLKDISCVICAIVASVFGAIFFPINDNEGGETNE